MRLLPLVLLIASLAGCLSPTPGDPLAAVPADPADPFGGYADPLLVAHDHNDASLHDMRTATMEHLGGLNEIVPTLSHAEADILDEDHLVVANLLDGFSIIDVSEPAAPRVVGRVVHAGFNGDVKASESGNFVFLGVQLAGGVGVQAYNVAVREAPVAAGYWPLDAGCHMLAVHAGHLYCAPNDETVRIFEIVEAPAAAAVALVPVGAYAPHGEPTLLVAGHPAQGRPGILTHDMTVQDDPLSGEPVMFVSFWDDGVHVVDVSDPSSPVQLGRWAGEGAGDEYEGNIHTSMASLVDGRRIIATLPEYALAPSVTFLDATDYANLTVIGTWVPKPAADYADESSTFSTHNFQFLQGRVYLAMYHGGVWVLDAGSLDALREPQALGYDVTAGEGTAPVRSGGVNVWDVVILNGYLYATDLGGGIRVLHYLEDPLGDPAYTSFA